MFGGLDLHGLERETSWTRLEQTAEEGSDTITLNDAVDWVAGDKIVIAPTGYRVSEAEIRTIDTVSGKKLTLTKALQYEHRGTLDCILVIELH